jgi:cyanate permease
MGRLVLGMFAHRVDVRGFAAWSMASQAAALAAMIATAHPAALYLACAVYGFSAGNLITLPSLVVQREFEAASFGMLVGLSWAITQFTYAGGPGLLGALRDLTGGYAIPIALCAGLKLAATALILLRPMSRRIERSQQAPVDFR